MSNIYQIVAAECRCALREFSKGARDGLVAVALCIPLSIAVSSPVASRGSGTWADQPLQIRQWFMGLMQPDAPEVSCCGEADAYEADLFDSSGAQYVAIITDGHGVIPDGTRIVVPIKKMKLDGKPPNPTGHGIIFIGSGGQVYCYVTPGGG